MAVAVRTVSALRQGFPFIPPQATVDHLVIGGGAVGLAIGRELIEKFKNKSTFIVERNPQPGQETSSRNSEVIHAGIYYPQDSLKTALCLRGRKLLYDYCQKHKIPHKKIGKLVISRSETETEYLKKLYNKCEKLNQDNQLRKKVLYGQMEDRDQDVAPLKILNRSESLDLEPNLSHDVCFSLFSPETGVFDSHSFIASLENSIDSSEDGQVVYSTDVVRIDRSFNDDGWVVQTRTNSQTSGHQSENNSVLTKCLVNCAGLNAHNIYNQVLHPRSVQLHLGFCKGSYYSYTSKKGVELVKHLIYPTPNPGLKHTNFDGLGTHLTLDMNQKIKFGPDVEWLMTKMVFNSKSHEDNLNQMNEEMLNEELQDFWKNHLNPNNQRLEVTYQSVKTYLPGVVKDHFSSDYSGIRPKLMTLDQVKNESNLKILVPKNDSRSHDKKLLNDFYIRISEPGLINLLGIESPGLTSSLAIAEHVVDLIRLHFCGNPPLDVPHCFSKLDQFSSVGNLNDWS